jgi:hypothetical protein
MRERDRTLSIHKKKLLKATSLTVVLLSVAIMVLGGAASAVTLNAQSDKANVLTNGGNEAPLGLGDSSSNSLDHTGVGPHAVIPLEKERTAQPDRGYNIPYNNGLGYSSFVMSYIDNLYYGWDELTADDFLKFTTTPYEGAQWCIDDVHWIGGYYSPWSAHYLFDKYNDMVWVITIYEDDGTGNAPGDVYAGPYTYNYADLTYTQYYYSSSWGEYGQFGADLPEIVCFPGCGEKFWIQIHGLGDTYWDFPIVGVHTTIMNHEMDWKSDYYGYPDWESSYDAYGSYFDYAFFLTQKFDYDATAVSVTINYTDWCECVGVTATVSNIGANDLVDVPVNVIIKQDFGTWDFSTSTGWLYDAAWVYGSGMFTTSGTQSGYLYETMAFDTSASCNPKVCFDMYHDTLGSNDYVQVVYSTNGGTTWIPVGDQFKRLACPDCTAGWKTHCVVVPKLAGMQIGFFTFADGIVAAYPLQIDNVKFSDIAYDETILVDIPVGETIDVVFPDFCPCQWASGIITYPAIINYVAQACTQLVGDWAPANDCSPLFYFSLQFPYQHDVGIKEIKLTDNGCNNYDICAVVKNYGQYEECCFKTYFTLETLTYGDPVWVPGDVTLLNEGFEGGVIPSGWFQTTYGGDPGVWEIELTSAIPYPATAYGSGYQLVADSDAHSSWYYNVDIATKPMDMTGLTSVSVSFASNFNALGSDIFAVSMYSGVGYSWEEDLLVQTTDDVNVYSGGSFYSFTIDPSLYTDPSHVMIVFWYYTAYTWEWDAAVDNVQVVAYGGHWEPTLIWTTVYSDWFCIDCLPVCAEQTVCFKDWTPAPGTNCENTQYRACAWTALCDPMDENILNDKLCQMVDIYTGHDVGVEIIQPVKSTSPWYAHEFMGDIDFSFAPETPGTMTTIGTNTLSPYAGTWAKGAWYQYDYTSGNLYTVATDTGAQTPVVTLPASLFNGIAFDGTKWYGCSSTALYTFDVGTGVATQIGSFGTGGLMIDIGIDVANGKMYGHDIGTDAIYGIDMTSGAVTQLATTGYAANYAQGAEFDNDNGKFMLALFDGATYYARLLEFDPATSTVTHTGDFGYYLEVDSLAIPYSTMVWLPCGEHDICANITNLGTFDEVDDPATICDYEGVTVDWTLVEYTIDPCDPCGPYIIVPITSGTEQFDLPCGETHVICVTYDFDVSGLYGIEFTASLFDDYDCDLTNNVDGLMLGIDCCAPIADHTIKPAIPDGCNNWYLQDVTVTITAYDPLCPDPCYGFASGLKEIHYKLNGVETVKAAESVTFKVTTEGVNLIEYWAVDNLGNVGDHHTFEIAIDKTKPTVDLIYEKIEDGTLQVKFTAVTSDAISGIQKVEFYIGTELKLTLTAPPFVWTITWEDAFKTQTFKAKAYDMACNSAEDTVFGGDIPGAKVKALSGSQALSQTLAHVLSQTI